MQFGCVEVAVDWYVGSFLVYSPLIGGGAFGGWAKPEIKRYTRWVRDGPKMVCSVDKVG